MVLEVEVVVRAQVQVQELVLDPGQVLGPTLVQDPLPHLGLGRLELGPKLGHMQGLMLDLGLALVQALEQGPKRDLLQGPKRDLLLVPGVGLEETINRPYMDSMFLFT